jgi:hypothetical protein
MTSAPGSMLRMSDRLPGPAPLRLSVGEIEAIAAATAAAVAERILEVLHERERQGFVDAAELARVLGVDREWIYTHSDELGAIRLSEGPRPRLRFELAGAMASFRELAPERRVLPLRPRQQAPVPRPRRSTKGRR